MQVVQARNIGVLIILFLVAAGCNAIQYNAIYSRGWLSGKVDSMPTGVGGYGGTLVIKEPYQIENAKVYIKANKKKYYAQFEPGGRFGIGGVPCGSWPIYLIINKESHGKRFHEHFKGVACITSQHNNIQFIYLEPQSFF